jgi:dihydrofolate reductase
MIRDVPMIKTSLELPMVNNVPVVIVAGMGSTTRVIGHKNGLIWHVPADMKRFKALTLGKPIIMGRKTFESIIGILGKPLPGRTNIVVTRQADYDAPEGVVVTATLEEAFAVSVKESPLEIHIGGGAELYRQALPYVDRIHMTLFHDETPGDTTFPVFEDEFGEALRSDVQEYEGLEFEWVDYVRKI